MRYQLDLKVKPAEGALVRVIGMVERRGFAPRAIHATPDADGRWTLKIEIESPRQVETLCRQLAKVYDCESVDASPVAASLEAAA